MKNKLLKLSLGGLLLLVLLAAINARTAAGGVIIPTDSTQDDFLKAYKMMLYQSYVDYRFTSSTIDTNLFPAFGEFSPYWIRSGENKGSFVFPDKIPGGYSSVSSSEYNTYNWQNDDHYSIQYKPSSKRAAIFKSKITRNNNTVSWGAIYFKNMFDSYLYGNIYYYVDEDYFDGSNLNSATQLLIIPSFTLDGTDNKHYIDSVFAVCPDLKNRIDSYLQSGGTIYAEGNAVYFIEKLGLLDSNAVDFENSVDPDPVTNLVDIEYENTSNPLSFMEKTVGGKLYANACPMVDAGNAEITAKCSQNGAPAVFVLKGDDAGGGRIICNTGIPTIGGMNELKNGSRQLQWSLNAVMYSFSNQLDVTRSVYNELPDTLTAGKYAVSFDRLDTFEVRIKIRNMSSETIEGIRIVERMRRALSEGQYDNFFKIVDVKTSGVTHTIKDYDLILENITLAPHSEKVIVYRLRTPDPDDKIHEYIDNFLSWRTYIYASYGTIEYDDSDGSHNFWKYRNYVDIMFSAFLAADTDLNWKNFLGLYYQPFKVFMIMENKERTEARNTKYVQYIPKDVPFYWSDKSINIPILKTPGGKFVDVLRGSNDEQNPDYDLDSDGKPDAWLDTSSIYPKGYTITEEEVYWLNPWEHLRTGDKFYYEDIDHDGKRAQDTNGDGIVDVEEPGDKIRVWKVTWDMGTISGYEYFDPYCYYEIWVDPPNLVNMSAGVGYTHDVCEEVNGMYYPYSSDIENPNLADTSWTHWMERDENGEIVWKQFIYQSVKNYEGFTYIDTAKTGYTLKPTDRCAGTVPQPHREFIAVLSLGGEEIDMTHYRPQVSRYSNLEYTTIFGEHRKTPIRSTYTYYAPLPNPLQFEYLSNNYIITNTEGTDTLKHLPSQGTANITFEVDASTEYSYYWIRNVGHDVDYNDPSVRNESWEELGDGVFGYMVYDIPKGMGGYKIHLPKKEDGTYDIDAIVQVDGEDYERWLYNPNTKDSIEIWEDPFQYHIYIPQLLIPPALDDDNRDGIDDWIDDRGDRFCSSTGFLHDAFMLDDGEKWRDFPKERFKDDIYGWVDSGWYHGLDMTYGDDFFETLGKTHFTFNVIYEGLGREGPVQISKGGWLVVEEIFGGSPWVIFSHTLSGFAQGVDLEILSADNPGVVKFGMDTMFIKHTVSDKNEPHYFNYMFDPYHVSYGYGESTITTYAGGKDPCSLILPSVKTSTLIDPDFDKHDLTLVPFADTTNPDLEDYPKQVSGCFLQARVEVMNGTDDNWLFTKVIPHLDDALGETELVMSYVAYPRPLVPAKVDPQTGEIIQGGDDFGTFREGWRFNEPEGEVLVKMGNELPLLMPSRRAYFIFLFKIDTTLEKGIYQIGFSTSGTRRNYMDDGKMLKKDGILEKNISYEPPPLQFSIIDRNDRGNIVEFQQMILGTAKLDKITTNTTDYFRGLENVKWSFEDVNHTDFNEMTNILPAKYDEKTGIETIDLSSIGEFPTIENNLFYVLEKGKVYSYDAGDDVEVSESEQIHFDYPPFGKFYSEDDEVVVTTVGPKIKNYKEIAAINGEKTKKDSPLSWPETPDKDVEILFEVTNYGNNLAENTTVNVYPGTYFTPNPDSLPENCTIKDGILKAAVGPVVPGETKRVMLHFNSVDDVCGRMYDESTLIPAVDVTYKGSTGSGSQSELFAYTDEHLLDAPAYDLKMDEISTSMKDLEAGDIAKIRTKLKNGVLPSLNVSVEFFTILEAKDTIPIEEVIVDSIGTLEEEIVGIDYVVPDSVNFIEIFAVIDGGCKINEFCENNNRQSFILPLKAPAWIIDVKNSPNPMAWRTLFSYILPKPVENMKIEIFSLDGFLVGTVENCPGTEGVHSVEWKAPNLTDGVYVYKITAKSESGKMKEYHGSLIKNYR